MTDTVPEYFAEALQATMSESLAQGPYVADRAGVELMTLRTKGVDSTKAPAHSTRGVEAPTASQIRFRLKHWYCVGVNTTKNHRHLRVKDLPKVPTWTRKWDSTFTTYLVRCGCKQNKCCSKCSWWSQQLNSSEMCPCGAHKDVCDNVSHDQTLGSMMKRRRIHNSKIKGSLLNRSPVPVVAAFADLGTTTAAVTDDTESTIEAFLYANCMSNFGWYCWAIVETSSKNNLKVRNCRQPEELYTLNHHSCTFPGYGVVSVPSAKPSVSTPNWQWLK